MGISHTLTQTQPENATTYDQNNYPSSQRKKSVIIVKKEEIITQAPTSVMEVGLQRSASRNENNTSMMLIQSQPSFDAENDNVNERDRENKQVR